VGSEAAVCTLHLEEVGTGCLPGVLINGLLSGHKVIVDGERVDGENDGESFMTLLVQSSRTSSTFPPLRSLEIVYLVLTVQG
jgi:hypothetical protein